MTAKNKSEREDAKTRRNRKEIQDGKAAVEAVLDEHRLHFFLPSPFNTF
jgi:hypothetical protein